MTKIFNLPQQDTDKITAEWYNSSQLGPLASRYTASSWQSGTTTGIEVQDDDDFEAFLDSHKVVHYYTNGAFLLYTGGGEVWPMMSEDDITYKNHMLESEDFEDDVEEGGESHDPLEFWRQIVRYMKPKTYFRAINIGSAGCCPMNLDRQTNYYAMAITVSADGTIETQDFEDYLIPVKFNR